MDAKQEILSTLARVSADVDSLNDGFSLVHVQDAYLRACQIEQSVESLDNSDLVRGELLSLQRRLLLLRGMLTVDNRDMVEILIARVKSAIMDLEESVGGVAGA